MSRRQYGDRDACRYCGQDIEWHGREVGWIDRGSGRGCCPYEDRKRCVMVYPKTKHAPPRRTK